jgi:hypothetical protein
MPLRGLALCALIMLPAFAAAGCGGGGASKTAAAPGPIYKVETVEVQVTPTPKQLCHGLSKHKQELQRRKLERDLRELRAAAATIKGHTENGNAAINKVLDRFLLDVADVALPVHQRSRFIDLAAAIVSPKCYLCFQALESNRPIAGGAKLRCG